jgi:hypothetical protein
MESINTVIEIAPFVLASGVSEKELIEASVALQENFLGIQPGFIKRELVKGEGNVWMDFVYWKDRQAANLAMKQAAESPVCHQYFQLMEAEDHSNPTNGVKLYECIASY